MSAARAALREAEGQFDPSIVDALDEIPDRTFDEIRRRDT